MSDTPTTPGLDPEAPRSKAGSPPEYDTHNLSAAAGLTDSGEPLVTSDPPGVAAGPHPFATGARPSPRFRLLLARPFVRVKAAPPQVAYVPSQLDPWGNQQYGDCVTAEEAFKCATYVPEIFIPPSVVIDWARRHGVLNGAALTDVLDAMQRDGFQVGGQRYNSGPYQGVNYNDPVTLQSAIATGPVKIAIASSSLPRGAGQQQGWYAFGGGRNPNTDHCVSVAGYGPTEWLYQQLGVPLPGPAAGRQGYLIYTWATIGVVDQAWLNGTCVEAWVRDPDTVGVPPLPPEPTPTPPPVPPSPPTPPTPPPTPPPGPSPDYWDTVRRVLIQLSADGVKPRKILANLPKIMNMARQGMSVEDIVDAVEGGKHPGFK